MGIRARIIIRISGLILFILLSQSVYAQEVVIRDNITTGRKANVSTLGTINGLNTDAVPATTIFDNQVTVVTAGTRVQLSGSSIPVRSVCIKALTGNTGNMYVGNASVSASNGYELPKDLSVCLDVNNLNLVYIDSSVNGEKVAYAAVN